MNNQFTVSCGNTKTNSSNTPKEAAQAACDEILNDWKSITSESKEYIMEEIPSGMQSTVEPMVDEMIEVTADSYDIKVKDVTVDGDTATASVDISFIDQTELSKVIENKISQHNYELGDFKKIIPNNLSYKMTLQKENNQWIANKDDIFDYSLDKSYIRSSFIASLGASKN